MDTLARNPVADLVTLWRRELCSFLDYLVAVSAPVAVDETDRKILEAFAGFHRGEQELRDRCLELMFRLGIRPDGQAWPMQASTYNFMRPRNLAEVFLRLATRDRDELAAAAARYDGAEALEERLVGHLLHDYVAARDAAIANVGALCRSASADASAAMAPVPAKKAGSNAPEGAPWHDESLAIEERMDLAKGKGLFEQLFAAMAQTDCTACGYDCEGYARAIADGSDKDLTKCAPGELETQRMLEKLMGKK